MGLLAIESSGLSFWSFDTWILCHKDPSGPIGIFGSQSTFISLDTPTVYFSESIHNIHSNFPCSVSTSLGRSCTIQSSLVFLSDSLILRSSKSGGVIGYDSRLRYVVYL
jgi:hypothetical protein